MISIKDFTKVSLVCKILQNITLWSFYIASFVTDFDCVSLISRSLLIKRLMSITPQEACFVPIVCSLIGDAGPSSGQCAEHHNCSLAKYTAFSAAL